MPARSPQPSRRRAPPAATRPARRQYDQYCGIARSLEVIGGRWTLLLIRELMTGPRRFRELLTALPRMGTNLLADRLRELVAAGVVRHSTSQAHAGVAVYELTERGAALEPLLLELSRWGLPLLGERGRTERLSSSWALMGMKAAFRPERAANVHDVYQLEVGDEVFTLRVEDGRLFARRGAADRPDVTIRTTPDVLLALASGNQTVDRALKAKAIAASGPKEALARAVEIFRPAAPQPQR